MIYGEFLMGMTANEVLDNFDSQEGANSSEVQIEVQEPKDDGVEVSLDPPSKEESKEKDWGGVPPPKYVETDDPDILARINYLTREKKTADEKREALLDHNKALAARLDDLERTVTTQKDNDAMSNLRSQLVEAQEDGDVQKVVELTEAMADLKAEQKLNVYKGEINKEENIPDQSGNVQPNSEQIKLAKQIDVYVHERDEKGDLKRPFLLEGHPDHEKAVEKAAQISQLYNLTDIDVIMKELDKSMGVGRKVSSDPSVLSTDRSINTSKKKIRLTQEQVNMSRKLGISPEEYARQMEYISKNNNSSRISISDL